MYTFCGKLFWLYGAMTAHSMTEVGVEFCHVPLRALRQAGSIGLLSFIYAESQGCSACKYSARSEARRPGIFNALPRQLNNLPMLRLHELLHAPEVKQRHPCSAVSVPHETTLAQQEQQPLGKGERLRCAVITSCFPSVPGTLAREAQNFGRQARVHGRVTKIGVPDASSMPYRSQLASSLEG